MIAMREQLFTPEQVADAWQVSTDTVMRLIRSKKLGAVKIGKLWRISETHMAEYLSERQGIKPEEDKK